MDINYNEIRPYIKSGDVMLWATKSLIGFLIRWFTKSDVNHASLILRMDYEGLHDRVFLLEANEPGIVLTLLSRRVSEYQGNVYWLPLRPEYDLRRQTIISYGLKKVGVKYDYESLIAQAFGRVNRDASKFFCSEFVHMALEIAGIHFKSEKALRPGDFEKYKDIFMFKSKIFGV